MEPIKLDDTLGLAFTRLPGRLVRIEADEGLLAVWNEAESREELRSIDVACLRDAKILEEGAALVLYEIEFTPHGKTSLVVAVPMAEIDPELIAQEEARLQAEESRLRELETTLPLDLTPF